MKALETIPPDNIPPSPTGNASLVCHIASVLMTVGVLILMLVGGPVMLSLGLPLFIMTFLVGLAGLVLGIVSWRRREERFRYLFATVLNATLLFCLVMMVVIYYMVQANMGAHPA